ncbi:Cytochrome b5 domain-containing protein 1 [Nibea albiflora]|uniref:Cytochrome b5 domain-containing protein 1 n=1 Tax=Nibea albiflora TaxID=240163 RepID=A0ACB7EUR3_NIBAL|nr:Cytochrome b5 domain-containing protein 1 [Nibea albiflora]
MGRPKYFTPAEVATHNTASDLWVSFLGKVCDLTPLMDQYKGDALLLPIMESAGKDISFWFDPETKDVSANQQTDQSVSSSQLLVHLRVSVLYPQVQKHVDPLTNCVRYYTPRGRFVHIPPAGPRSDWASDIRPPWWRDKTYEVGLLTSKTRWIRIINTLTSQEQLLEVCSEETLAEILQRYLHHNSHACSYTWKHDGAPLDMSGTLSENNVLDDDPELEQLRLDRDLFTPAILLHFNDDLTEG